MRSSTRFGECFRHSRPKAEPEGSWRASFSGFLRPATDDVRRDIDALLWSHRLQGIPRYFRQPYWNEETSDAIYAERLMRSGRLETVAEHSWNVADAVLLLAWRFPYISDGHAVRLAVLHDKMEIVTGDANPLGRDGTGAKGHAFDGMKQLSKEQREEAAIEQYVKRLNPEAQAQQRTLLREALQCHSPEARFVKAIDKMQALCFILLRKGGTVADKHLEFLLKFTEKNDRHFPPLAAHNGECLRRIFIACARARDERPAALLARVSPNPQLALDLAGQSAHKPAPTPTDYATTPPGVPTKKERMRRVFSELKLLPPARTGIEAVTQVTNCLNRVEDEIWGEHWEPPRYVPPGTTTARLYPVAGDSTYPVDGWLVDVLVTHDECIYISGCGAIEIQRKNRSGSDMSPSMARECVLFEKPDIDNDGVWSDKNIRDQPANGTAERSGVDPMSRFSASASPSDTWELSSRTERRR